MKNQWLSEGLKMILEIIVLMISIWLFFAGGIKTIIGWFRDSRKKKKDAEELSANRFKALEDKAEHFQNELSDFKEKHKDLKHDIEILETDYKEIFKILLNRK